jgi:hypothetical protein
MGDTPSLAMSEKLYDLLKWVALVLLPGLSALYFGLGQIWNLPAVEQVVGTVTVLDTFLGLVIKQSSKNYQNTISSAGAVVGELAVKQKPDGEVTGMGFIANRDPLVLPSDKKVVFEVRREPDFDSP